jgi:hypothetical protein
MKVSFSSLVTLPDSKGCYYLYISIIKGSRDSAVGTVTGYGLDERRIEVRVQVGSRIFFSPRRPDQFWGPSSLLLIAYGGLFPRG